MARRDFHTTRFVRADSLGDAADGAGNMVYGEIAALFPNHADDDWSMTIAEIREIDSREYAEFAPGLGLSWFTDDSEVIP